MAYSRLGDVLEETTEHFSPACVVKFRQTFPSEQYCGFKYAQV